MAFSPPLLALSLDERINQAVRPIGEWVSSVIFYSVPVGGTELPLIVAWLVLASLVCTVALGFVNLRGFGHALRIVRGDSPFSTPSSPGTITHFQALSTAVSGTVGIGNMSGVAVAVAAGGPGATFWMILAGLLGMSAKFVECTLGVKYRRVNPDGTVSGGPMHYLSRGLADLGLSGLGKAMAAVYALFLALGALGIGNMFQSNQAYAIAQTVTGGDASFLNGYAWAYGLVFAALGGAVIIGGIGNIARVTARLVPFMAGLYLIMALVVIGVHFSGLPAAIGAIVQGAFTPEGVAGGALGALIQGFRRATFSNEAGLGSSSIAHSAVRTDQPATEGYVAMLEPFIDTVVVCTLSALVIILTGAYHLEGLSGIAMTSAAFASVAPWLVWPLALAATLFAFSTLISWSYYGTKAAAYLLGDSRAVQLGYSVLFLIATVIGASLDLSDLIDLSDALIFAVCIPNVIGIYLLLPTARREMQRYRAAYAAQRRGRVAGD
ncbi:alanine/glycine:cation symporter family protein [Deinococcus sp. Marseille-Q6407]|uniref:alanine/glycine:cation symporter family protein n=1 Tax=Deinococcus sp. Marseille-Q6407 TaxID=2969223 RepID=UPI0021BE78BC|nr:alanine:cation symporter family protein [Deinococcus sp. Marseille-Q6407]